MTPLPTFEVPQQGAPVQQIGFQPMLVAIPNQLGFQMPGGFPMGLPMLFANPMQMGGAMTFAAQMPVANAMPMTTQMPLQIAAQVPMHVAAQMPMGGGAMQIPIAIPQLFGNPGAMPQFQMPIQLQYQMPPVVAVNPTPGQANDAAHRTGGGEAENRPPQN
jgi:hypothetical protein